MNFEFWINGELSKIGHHFSNKIIQTLILFKKNSIRKRYATTKLAFFNEKKIDKDLDDF